VFLFYSSTQLDNSRSPLQTDEQQKLALRAYRSNKQTKIRRIVAKISQIRGEEKEEIHHSYIIAFEAETTGAMLSKSIPRPRVSQSRTTHRFSTFQPAGKKRSVLTQLLIPVSPSPSFEVEIY
jgi:hypothetical protein